MLAAVIAAKILFATGGLLALGVLALGSMFSR